MQPASIRTKASSSPRTILQQQVSPPLPSHLAPFSSRSLASHSPTLSPATASKDRIRTRLQWILEEFPTVNPFRAVLNRVNEFLLSKRR